MYNKSFRFISVLLLIPILTACSLFTFAPVPSQADIEKEEQAVYTVLIGKGSSPVLILENTSTGLPADDPKQVSDNLKSSFPNLFRETLNSFMERNKSTDTLSPHMQLGMDYVLLSQKELAAISSQPNWHEVLQARYPGSKRYIIFSHVGFNNTLDQAVIYVGNVEGPLMGSGYYYLMEKEGGEWRIKEQVMVWIS